MDIDPLEHDSALIVFRKVVPSIHLFPCTVAWFSLTSLKWSLTEPNSFLVYHHVIAKNAGKTLYPALSSTQPRGLAFVIPNANLILTLHALILQHACIFPYVITFDLQPHLRFLRLQQKVVITMRAVLVALIKLVHVFAETLFALFAREDHLHRLFERVRLCVGVALRTVEPLSAARGADRDLGVEDVFAGDLLSFA